MTADSREAIVQLVGGVGKTLVPMKCVGTDVGHFVAGMLGMAAEYRYLDPSSF